MGWNLEAHLYNKLALVGVVARRRSNLLESEPRKGQGRGPGQVNQLGPTFGAAKTECYRMNTTETAESRAVSGNPEENSGR